MTNGTVALNYNAPQAEAAFAAMVSGLPEGVTVYLIGGALRNALFRHFHGERLPQRDYDLVVTAGRAEFAAYLASLGYNERPYPGKTDQTVFNLPLNDAAALGDSYDNWLVLDIHYADGSDIAENIRRHAVFTVNGLAVDIRDVLNKPWDESLVTLPGTLEGLRDKQLRLNRDGYASEPAAIYACLRFVHVGFLPPSPEEIQLMLNELPNLPPGRHERNLRKLYNYVGSEAEARRLAQSLNIGEAIFSIKK